MKRLLALSLIAIVLSAQTVAAQVNASPRLQLGFHFGIGRAAAGSVCDGHEITSISQRRTIGKVLLYGGFAAVVIAPLTAMGGKPVPVGLVAVGAVAWVGGWALARYSQPSDQFWQTTIPKIKPGQTTSDDIRECFQSPSSTTIAGTDQTWIYRAKSPALIGGSDRTMTVTFNNGVVHSVSQTKSDHDQN